MEEIWKDVVGYEGLYQVSNLGKIRSLDREIKTYNGGSYIRKGIILKQMKNYQGYMRVHLMSNGKVETCTVHRIVAQAFIPNPNNYNCVNHKNEIRDYNNVENLEWCTQEYNCNYGTHSEKISKSNGQKVNQYDLNGNFIKCWHSMRKAERELNIPNQSISLCCLGKRHKAGGFKWRYCNET